jgi:hypothetical protein
VGSANIPAKVNVLYIFSNVSCRVCDGVVTGSTT